MKGLKGICPLSRADPFSPFDKVGNRVKEISSEGETVYTYQANKLTAVTGAKAFSVAYDANGNTVAENTRRYIYNQNQRLMKVVEDNVNKGEYFYNGTGQRVKKTTDKGAVTFHYDLKGQLIAESSTTGAFTAEYVYLLGQPLAKVEDNNIYYYHSDHLGTPQGVIDGTGQVVWKANYEPFGKTTITGTITNNLRFPGQYHDEETGLHQNWFRNYDWWTGRYIEADPIGIKKGKNHLYVYVANNTLRYADPMGLVADFPRPDCTPLEPSPQNCSIYKVDCNRGDLTACVLYQACLNLGNGKWRNCVRCCLQSKYQNCNKCGCIVWDHYDCWMSCPGWPL